MTKPQATTDDAVRDILSVIDKVARTSMGKKYTITSKGLRIKLNGKYKPKTISIAMGRLVDAGVINISELSTPKGGCTKFELDREETPRLIMKYINKNIM